MSTSPLNATTTLSDPVLTSVYDEVTTTSKVVETMVMIVIMIITTVGNVCLWVVVLRSRALRTLTSMFILGLSTADILVGVVNMPITVYTIIMGRWEFSHSTCVVFGFLNMITLVTSVLSLCNISINRYVMVCYPQQFKGIYTVRNAVVMIIGVVIFSILLSLPPLIGWSEYVYTPSHSFCFADWQNHMSYAFFMIGCCFGIPFMVMSVCNVLILRSVRASRLRVKASLNPQPSAELIEITKNHSTHSIKSEHISTEHIVRVKGLSFNMSFLRSRIEEKIKNTPPVTEIIKVSNNNSTHSNSNREPNKAFLASTFSAIDLDSWPYTNANAEPLELKLTPRSTKVRMTSIRMTVIPPTTTSKSPSARSTHSTLTRKQRSIFLHSNWKPASENTQSGRGLSKPANSISPLSDVSEITPSGRGSPEPAISIDLSSDVSPVVNSNSETEISAHGSVNDVQMTKSKKRHTPLLRRREEIRLAFSLIIVVVVFVICWLPYCISMLLSIFYLGHVPREFHMFTIIIGYANSCCNPIIYGVMNTRFKDGFRRIFCLWKYRNSSNLSCS